MTMLWGCVGESKYNKLLKENEELRAKIELAEKELDDYWKNPSRLLYEANDAFNSSNREELDSLVNILIRYHPQRDERKDAELLLSQYDAAKQAELEAIEKEKEEERKQRLVSLNKLKKEQDDILSNTIYKNPYFTHYNNRNLISIYIVHNVLGVKIRLKMSYSGDDWIFFERAYLSYEDGTTDVPFDEYRDKKSDNDGEEVWEWINVELKDHTASFLRKMVNGKTPKMRLSGKYSRTRNLSVNEIKGIKDVFAGYDALVENGE